MNYVDKTKIILFSANSSYPLKDLYNSAPENPKKHIEKSRELLQKFEYASTKKRILVLYQIW